MLDECLLNVILSFMEIEKTSFFPQMTRLENRSKFRDKMLIETLYSKLEIWDSKLIKRDSKLDILNSKTRNKFETRYTRNSKFETRNSKIETRNSIHVTRNSKYDTRNSILETRNSILETRNSILETRDSKMWLETLDSKIHTRNSNQGHWNEIQKFRMMRTQCLNHSATHNIC